MSWLSRLLPSSIRKNSGALRRPVPEGLWVKCESCQAVLYQPELLRHLEVCPKCDYHHRIPARRRLAGFLDTEPAPEELSWGLRPVDHLKFKDHRRYRDRLQQAERDSGEQEALLSFAGSVHRIPLVACSFEFGFMGGSMGAVVGEHFVRTVHVSRDRKLPLVCFCASGGARMQEGLSSLMQMAKTSAALAEYRAMGLPFVTVLADPTMGGVTASIASLGDIIIAEPGALIGFAGPKVIAQTMRESLPEGFQRSEFLLQHGSIDLIVPRTRLRTCIAGLLSLLLDCPAPRLTRPGVDAEVLPLLPARDATQEETSSA